MTSSAGSLPIRRNLPGTGTVQAEIAKLAKDMQEFSETTGYMIQGQMQQ